MPVQSPSPLPEQNLGVWPDAALQAALAAGFIRPVAPLAPDQLQPASLDLRLGAVAYRIRASFLPGPQRRVEERLDANLVMHQLDLTQGAVLERGCVYLVPLMESLALPAGVAAVANPKSSTGRIDVFTRMICDYADRFDCAPAGYQGPLYAEISPCTFSILARAGARLSQLRLRTGEARPVREETFAVDLARPGPAGYRARRHAGVIDVDRVGAHDPRTFWEPLAAEGGRLVLDPGEFYILSSLQDIVIPADEAAEMAPIQPDLGEFRAHYAGFFDPGFGLEPHRGKAVLEMRSRDVPFILEHGQPVGRLVFERLTGPCAALYGAAGGNYRGQGLKLSKHFAPWA